MYDVRFWICQSATAACFAYGEVKNAERVKKLHRQKNGISKTSPPAGRTRRGECVPLLARLIGLQRIESLQRKRKQSWKARPRPFGLRYGGDKCVPKQSLGTRRERLMRATGRAFCGRALRVDSLAEP